MCAVKAGPLAGPLQSSGGVLKSRWPPWAPDPSSPYGLCGRKATLEEVVHYRALELCESGGGHPGLPVPNSPYCRCGRKVTLKKKSSTTLLCVRLKSQADSADK